jgi:tryptophanyl-tRNA synthetase
MTRDIAQKFNQAFGETFTLPEPVIMEDVAVVPGIDGQKMSKSYGNTIPLFGDDAAIKKSIMGIVTDSKGVEEPKDPDSNVIFQLHRLFLSSAEQKKLAEKYRNGGLGYGDAKKMLLETYMDFMKPMREKREKISKDKKYLEKVRKEGAEKALHLAEKTMVKVRKAVGLQ